MVCGRGHGVSQVNSSVLQVDNLRITLFETAASLPEPRFHQAKDTRDGERWRDACPMKFIDMKFILAPDYYLLNALPVIY